MKTCKRDPSQIHKLVEGELDSREHSELTEHLESCSHCSKILSEVSSMRNDIKTCLNSKIQLRDVELVARRAAETKPIRHFKRTAKGILKRAVIATAAGLAVIIISAYLFVHFYFGKTFSYQISKTVMRCSDGIERKAPVREWETVRVGDSLDKGTLIRTPRTGRSFMSFDGIRLLTEGEVEFKLRDKRALSLQRGQMVIASAERETPVNIAIGETSIRTNGGVLRVERTGKDARLGVASGTAELTKPDGTNHKLVENQTVNIAEAASDFEVVHAQVIDPFARRKVSALDRAKERFARMLAKYFPDYQRTLHAMQRLDGPGILETWNRPQGMYQFASFGPSTTYSLAQASAATLDEYYENLFVPSNRWLSVGRQKVVPVEPGRVASFPMWSHDGSMIAYPEYDPNWWPTTLKVARLDDLENPWVISQEVEMVLPFFPVTWAPDDKHVLFMVADHMEVIEKPGGYKWWWRGPHHIMIAPIDPSEGPIREFESPFHDIPMSLPIPVGKTISPIILKLPWGDAALCANWGNLAYIPIEEDGQSMRDAAGVFLTDFNPRDLFVMGGCWSPSGGKIVFAAAKDFDFDHLNAYVLYDVEDILDGFTEPPRSLDDSRLKRIAPAESIQIPGGFSFDESLVFYTEDVNEIFDIDYPTSLWNCDFDLHYANALPGEDGQPTRIRLPGNQMHLRPSPEGNRLVYCNYVGNKGELRLVSFDIEADIDVDLGGVLIDNSGTNLIVPPGTLEENFGVTMSTPFSMGEEAEFIEGEEIFFAMRLINAKGLENPEFAEPMTLTIRYTDGEVEGLDEWALDIYYYDESDPDNPRWVPLGATVDPEYNEITVEIQHFSKFAVGGRIK